MDTQKNICSYKNITTTLNNNGYKVTHFGTVDMCATGADDIAITKEGLLIIITTIQDCEVSSDEIELQKKIIDNFEFTKPLEEVCG
jgi:hypothetical protein